METMIPLTRIKKLAFRDRFLWIFSVILVAINQHNLKSQFRLGQFYARIGDLLSAEECFAKAASKLGLEEQMQRDALYLQARCKQERGDHNQALALLKLLSWEEKSERVRIAQAVGFTELEMWDQAELAARAAYLLNPLNEDKTARGLLVQASFRNGKVLYASIMLESMLKSPTIDDAVLLQNWVEMLCVLKKFDKAEEVVEQLIVLLLDNLEEIEPDRTLAYALAALGMRIGKSLHNKPLQALTMDLAKAVLPPPIDVLRPIIT
jgi:tetratricopeptide (TPR) repeat protein